MKRKHKDLLYDKENPYTGETYYMESDRRDVYYSALIKDLVANNRAGQKLKYIFFVTICAVFISTCCCGMYVIYTMSQKDVISYADIGVALTGFGSVLSAIIVLPKIIAKHLFPQNSEQVRFKFINDVQKFDNINIDAANDTSIVDDDTTIFDDSEETE